MRHGNGPSNRIPQRLGFTPARIEPRAELLENGRYTDANVYLLDLAEHTAPADGGGIRKSVL